MRILFLLIILGLHLTSAQAQDFEFINYSKNLDVDVILAEDHDQDGDLDLLTVAFNSGEDIFYIIDNDGSGTFSFEEKIIMDDVDITWPKFGDLNGDGLSDMVFSQRSNNEIFVQLNQGDGSFEKQSLDIFDIQDFTITDRDGDGDMDLIGTNEDLTRIHIYENSGDLNFTLTQTLGTSYEDVEDYVVGDFNQDGIADIAYLGKTSFTESSVDIFISDGLYVYIGSQLANEFGGPRSVAFHDYDGDGQTELIAHRSSELRAFSFIEENQFAETSLVSMSSITSFNFGDLTNDGLADIVVGFNASDVLLYTYQPMSQLLYSESNVGTVFPAFSPNIGDFDGDGLNDIAILSLFDLTFFRNKGVPSSTYDDDIMKDVIVYPNPFNSKIHIEDDSRKDVQFQIRDLNNKLIVTTKKRVISAPHLSSGIYSLTIQDNKTHEVKTIKLIKR